MASTDLRRGEIWLAALGAAKRGEPGKTRPVVIASADQLLTGADHELVVVVPLSSSFAPSAFRPEVTPAEGIDRNSAAICRAVRGLARSRFVRRLGAVEPDTLAAIDKSLGLVLGISR